MLTRRYVERKVEKRAYYHPKTKKLYVEKKGLLSSDRNLAEAVATAILFEADVLYLMPALGHWNDKRGQYPGKADWQATGLELGNYYRNHSATIVYGDQDIDIIPIGVWFPSFTEDMYMSDVIRAMAYLKDLLTKYFQPMEVAKGKHEEYRVELQSTPARTGMDLLRRKLPYGAKYEDLPEDVEHIVMSEFGQARNELFDHGQDTIEDLRNLDGYWWYASCCRHMPVGEVVHDTEGVYQDYVTGLYRIEAVVPVDWNHVGLLPMREGDKTVWPNRPGMVFESWCSNRDFQLAWDLGWHINVIKERILWPETQARGKKIGQDPLRHWMETLVMLREQIANNYPEPIRSFLRDAFRSLLNMTIGRLHMGARTTDVYTSSFEEYPGDKAVLAEEYLDGSYRYEKKEELNTYQKENFKPHWALEVWNQAKHKITKAALEVPYNKLISIRTDGLWTNGISSFDNMSISSNNGKPGYFREKPLLCTGPFEWPKNDLQFVQMIQRARHG